MISAKVLADSVSRAGIRLVTMEVVMPRFILAEFNTHRMLSRNSASSRAIPVEKQIRRLNTEPFVPLHWGKNQPGMSAELELEAWAKVEAELEWLIGLEDALRQAGKLRDLGLHKQIANRILEPWMWHTVIVTATDWANFYALRCHPAAQPEMRLTAEAMMAAHLASTPTLVEYGQWHLPLTTPEERAAEPDLDWKAISIGRCARVSYLTHDGVRDPAADVDLASRLAAMGHLSPAEHVATPILGDAYAVGPVPRSGNFLGWRQARKDLELGREAPAGVPWERTFRQEAEMFGKLADGFARELDIPHKVRAIRGYLQDEGLKAEEIDDFINNKLRLVAE